MAGLEQPVSQVAADETGGGDDVPAADGADFIVLILELFLGSTPTPLAACFDYNKGEQQ